MSQEQAITVTSKATAALEKVTAGVAKAVADLQSVADIHGALLENVAEGQQNLVQIQEDTEIAVRKAKVELDLQVAEHAEGVMVRLLSERNLEAVDTEELEQLRIDAVQGNRKLDAEITKAVNAALASERHTVALKAAEDSKDDAVKAAQTNAKIESLEAQLAASQREVASLTEQLSAEREAGVERARAAGSFTVNAGGK